jgi:hypothetical protein
LEDGFFLAKSGHLLLESGSLCSVERHLLLSFFQLRAHGCQTLTVLLTGIFHLVPEFCGHRLKRGFCCPKSGIGRLNIVKPALQAG